MAASYLEPIQRELDDNALPLSGAKLRFYANLTTTPIVVYSDAALSVPLLQPILSDAEGWYPRVFIPQGVYRRTRHTADDVLIDSEDDIDTGLSSSAGSLGVSQGGTGATTAAGARTNLGVPSVAVTDSLDTRTSNLESTLNAPLVEVATTTAYAASVALDFTANWSQQITLTGHLTLSAPTGTDGQEFRLFLIQDGTGGRSIVLNAAFKMPNGAIGFSTTAGSIDCIEGVVKGSDFHITSVKIQDAAPWAGYDAYIYDTKASGTGGGASTIGSDVTRALNTIEIPSGRPTIVSIAGNQFTISKTGTYLIRLAAPASQTNSQAILRDVTGSADLKRGRSIVLDSNATNVWSEIEHVHTIAASNTYEIRQRFTTAIANGMGAPCSLGAEIYTQVYIRRLA